MVVRQQNAESLGLTTTHPDIAADGARAEIGCMTKQALLSEILRLPPEERIELLGEAWDALAASPDDVPIPEWHVEEVERRLADPDQKYVPWEEVRDRLRAPNQS
jgi:putative addiction module component (TIGR02574 family)